MCSSDRDCIDKTAHFVRYSQAKPPSDWSSLVQWFWDLKTTWALNENFFHALPDACINILFDPANTRIAGVTALRTTLEVLHSQEKLHYLGIQLLPGV